RLSRLLLPRLRIGDDVRDMTLVWPCGVDRTGGLKINVPRGTDGVIRAQDGLERWCAIGGCNDGLVDFIRCIVRELDEQEKLGEGVVFTGNALRKPSLCDAEQLRKEPRLVVAFVIAEVSLQREP